LPFIRQKTRKGINSINKQIYYTGGKFNELTTNIVGGFRQFQSDYPTGVGRFERDTLAYYRGGRERGNYLLRVLRD
jgi:hypothetical protein